MDWSKQSTTHDINDSLQFFRITHPFHPYTGKQFQIVAWQRNWSEDRVYFKDDKQRLKSVPTGWTDLVVDDPVVFLSDGCSHFKVSDLLELAELMRGMR
jgi:hypothetical protein